LERYTYRARDAKGAIVRGEVSAESRVAALARLTRDGLVAFSVVKAAPGRRKPGWRPAATAAAAVFACAAIALWLCMPRPGKAPAGGGEKRGGANIPRAVRTDTHARAPLPDPETGGARGQTAAAPGFAETPPTATAVATPATEPPRERPRRRISLVPAAVDAEGNEVPLKPAFTSDTEIALSSLVSTPPGVEPVSLLPPDDGDGGFEADALSSLGRAIVIDEGRDGDGAAAQKEAVAWAKADLAAAMRNGHTARAHIDAVYRQLKEDAELRRDAVAALEGMVRANGRAEAARQLETVNAALEASGRPAIGEEEVFGEE